MLELNVHLNITKNIERKKIKTGITGRGLSLNYEKKTIGVYTCFMYDIFAACGLRRG